VEHDRLRRAARDANLEVVRAGLVLLTWGNVSVADRAAGVMAIKPSGVAYDALRPEDIVVLSLETGATIAGGLRPSSDTPTHLHLYRELPGAGAVVHTHSEYAVAWAQAERDLPCLGTTHADHFHGAVPCTRRLRDEEIRDAYEHHTGAVIVESFRTRGLDPAAVPGALVAGHGPFVWGASAAAAVENAIVLEAVARMAVHTMLLGPRRGGIPCALLDKHFLRKHGAEATYGQR